MSEKETRITHKRHLLYVMLFSIAVWFTFGVIAACLFPLSDITESSWDKGILIYLPVGLVLGVVIGFVLNRMTIVAHSSREDKEVPISRIPRIGRFLFGIKGVLLIVLLSSICCEWVACRQTYHTSVIRGRVPGLSSGQPRKVRMWTMRKVRERINSDYVLPLIDVLRNEDDVVIRRDAAEFLGRLRDKRAIEPLREVINKKIDESNKRYKPPSGMIVFGNPTEEDVKDAAKRSLGWIEMPDEIIEELRLKLDRAGNTGLREAKNQILSMGEDAIPVLKILLKNEDPGTRIRAIRWLEEIGKSEFSDTFIRVLHEDKDDKVREVAARVLGNMKEPRMFDVFIKVLEDIPSGPPPKYEPTPFTTRSTPGIRATVVGELGHLGDRRAIPYLEKALNDKYRNVRVYAAWALHDLDSVGSVPLLMKLLKDKDDEVMSHVADVLGRLGDKRAIKPILNELNAGRRPYYLIGGLGWLRAKEAVKPIMKFLQHSNWILRREAARALGQIGSNKPVNALIGLLQHRERDLRQAAAYALGEIGDNRAVPALIEALKDPELSEAAVKALVSITGKDFGKNFEKWEAWYNKTQSGNRK